MRILIDCLGSDLGFEEIIKGSLLALKEKSFTPVFYGKEEEIEKYLKNDNFSKIDYEIVDCTDEILNTDSPTIAIRRKKDSSMVKALKDLKNPENDGLISLGSTGALLAGATLIVGRIDGISRASLTSIIPGTKSKTIILDIGANVEVGEELLYEFYIMAKAYAISLGIENPTFQILNIGTEKGKGPDYLNRLYERLEKEEDGFRGFIESKDVLNTDTDVIITGGFAGNVLIKSIEGTAKTLMGLLKNAAYSNLKSKIGGLLLKDSLIEIKNMLDYKKYGSAPLLGSKKPVFKAHGRSDSTAVKNGILNLISFIEKDTIGNIEKIIEVKK